MSVTLIVNERGFSNTCTGGHNSAQNSKRDTESQIDDVAQEYANIRAARRVTSAFITSRSKLSKPGPKHSYPIKGRSFLTSNANKRICECSISKHSATFKLFEYLLIGETIWIESLFSRGFFVLSGVPSLKKASFLSDGTTAENYFSKKLT